MSEYYLRTHVEYEPKTIEEYRELIGSVEMFQTATTDIVYPDENEKVEYDQGPLSG